MTGHSAHPRLARTPGARGDVERGDVAEPSLQTTFSQVVGRARCACIHIPTKKRFKTHSKKKIQDPFEKKDPVFFLQASYPKKIQDPFENNLSGQGPGLVNVLSLLSEN